MDKNFRKTLFLASDRAYNAVKARGEKPTAANVLAELETFVYCNEPTVLQIAAASIVLANAIADAKEEAAKIDDPAAAAAAAATANEIIRRLMAGAKPQGGAN